ncbi:MAG: carbohydrate-binding domain-containing protein [Bacteroidales bacterium]|nr:carbohydrate-binding domain-containing protein [Bacteroidales bacterium]
MKKALFTIAGLLAIAATTAQTLNVTSGGATYQFPAAQTGAMTFSGGTTLTILNKVFTISDITAMTTDESTVKDNEVNVSYNGTEALVFVAGNIAQYVDVTVSGAHVTITQSDAVTNDLINGGTLSEITYNLSGASTDGSLTLGGSAKCTVAVNGLELTNPNGAPINITNGKRIAFSVKKGSSNILSDGEASTAKACLYCQGHLELKGKGELTVYSYGSKAHGIKSGDYTEMKNCTVNILKATKDGLSCNEYFLMESGTLTISGQGDDAIQCDIDNDEGTPIAATDAAEGGHEDEDTGNVYLEGGTINATVTADAAKGIKANGSLFVSEPDSSTPLTVNIATSGGGLWDSDKSKTKAASCMSADGDMTISGGTLNLSSSGAGGKGISVDGAMTISGGITTISTTGNAVGYKNGTLSVITSSQTLDQYDSDYKSSPKGIKADGNMVISGGTIIVTTSGCGGEGIESKGTLDITGGEIYVDAYDDGINSSSTMTITGGYIYSRGSANDGLDANGNLYIKGGVVFAVGAGGAEKSIDANTEGGYKLYIQGGTVIAVGNLENQVQISGGTCKYASSWSGQTWYALYNGGTLVAAFKTPTQTSSGGGWPAPSGGPGGGGPGGGSSSSLKLIVYTSSTPTLTSGVTVSGGTEYCGGVLNLGATVSGGSSVSLNNYTSSNW